MDISQIILKELRKRREIKVADIVKITGFSRAYINRFFAKLKNENKIALVGKANRAKYVLAIKKFLTKTKKESLGFKRTFQNINLTEDAVLDIIRRETGIFDNLSKNIVDILEYAFTEMLNNAIEHSSSKKIEVMMEKRGPEIIFRVLDRGIGIFRNIMKKRGLKNELEAIQDLLKGKQTTMPEAHTGEGIFFTSKIADNLTIRGANKKLIFDNLINDVFIKEAKRFIGTDVRFSVSKNSKKNLSDIFRQYTDDNYKFSKTKVTVKLYQVGVNYISRSQARRIVAGLDNFKTIILDFRNVETVGQAFADEVFRVFRNRHPEITLESINMNEVVSFMVKRAEII